LPIDDGSFPELAHERQKESSYVCNYEIEGSSVRKSYELGLNSKHTNNKAMEQTDLHTCRTPARLAFADHVNRLVTGNRAPSAPEGAKMLTRADPLLDRPMILFQYIVEILHRSMLAVLIYTQGHK
jgi:hypothetical protein